MCSFLAWHCWMLYVSRNVCKQPCSRMTRDFSFGAKKPIPAFPCMACHTGLSKWTAETCTRASNRNKPPRLGETHALYFDAALYFLVLCTCQMEFRAAERGRCTRVYWCTGSTSASSIAGYRVRGAKTVLKQDSRPRVSLDSCPLPGRTGHKGSELPA